MGTILAEGNYMEQVDSHIEKDSSLEEYLSIFLHNVRIVSAQGDNRVLFYRGQPNKEYSLTPSVFRKGLLAKEHTLISDMMLN